MPFGSTRIACTRCSSVRFMTTVELSVPSTDAPARSIHFDLNSEILCRFTFSGGVVSMLALKVSSRRGSSFDRYSRGWFSLPELRRTGVARLSTIITYVTEAVFPAMSVTVAMTGYLPGASYDISTELPVPYCTVCCGSVHTMDSETSDISSVALTVTVTVSLTPNRAEFAGDTTSIDGGTASSVILPLSASGPVMPAGIDVNRRSGGGSTCDTVSVNVR